MTYRQVKSKLQPHELYTPIPILNEPCIDILMDLVLGLLRSKFRRDSFFVVVDRFSKMYILFNVIKLTMYCILLICSLRKLRDCTKNLECLYLVKMLNFWVMFISCRGVKFMSYIWNTLWRNLWTNLLFLITCHQQTNGQTEVANRPLTTLLNNHSKEF